MKAVHAATMLMLSFGFVQAALADGKAPTAAADAGTTLIGQRDAAVGLYLLPWKEEAPSDIDLPPRQFDVADAPIDPARFAARVADDEANAAYRRVRLEPK
ncbi:hypothetical protein [Solimonas terrae]|uniref:Uncharacterized protein n=1 Tax=Solimonas terrae TaxID=1396819 RepID=A0A6M2BLY4_9GAMM|nr:hypothetical protein [Solimonas terrae]NGY03414.1 hypothetical protein [Solimonas terrae]